MNQRYILIVVALLITNILRAQTGSSADYPYKSDLSKGNYEKVESRVLKRLSKDSSNMECYYSAFQLYYRPRFRGHDEDRAYYYLTQAYRLYIHATPKQLDRATRNGYSGSQFDNDFRKVCLQAIATAHNKHSVDGYQHFLDYYTQAPDDLRDSVINARDTLELANAALSGTIASLQDFIDRRPNSKVLVDATRCRDSIAFAAADSLHAIPAYEKFRVAYPASHLLARATDSICAIEFRDRRKHDTELYYRSFAELYPDNHWADSALYYADSIEYHRVVDTNRWQTIMVYCDEYPERPYWNRHALELWASIARRQQLVEGSQQLLRRLPDGDSLRKPLIALLHNAYLHTSVRNYVRFYDDYPGLMPDSVRVHDSAAFAMQEQYNFYNSDSCIRAIAPYHEALMMLQQVLKDDIDHHRWTEAREQALQYQECFGDDYDYRQLVATLEAETEGDIKAMPLTSINTVNGDEYAPVVSADEKTLYFAGKRRPDNLGGSDIFMSRRTNSWSKGSMMMDLSHSYANEVPTGISIDGNQLIVLQGNQLLQVSRGSKGWEKAQPLPGLPADSNWKSDATLAANGRAIFFAAYSRTDRELDKSQNIFVSVMNDSGYWSAPIELGPMINTPFDDRSPLLHPDMHTLYFSSEGHGSLGQRDMYVCHRLNDSSWTEWSVPINIGKEVNGSDDDWGYYVTTDGRKAYFSRRTTSQDIYSINIPQRARPNPVTMVTGTVKNNAGKKVGTTIRWYDSQSGKLLGQCQSHPSTGLYTIALPQGIRYTYGVENERFKPQLETIDLTGNRPASNIKNDIFVEK